MHRSSMSLSQKPTKERFVPDAHIVPREDSVIKAEWKDMIAGALSVPPSAKMFPTLEFKMEWKNTALPDSGGTLKINERLLDSILEKPTNDRRINRIGPILEKLIVEKTLPSVGFANAKDAWAPSSSVVIDLMLMFTTFL
mmetsp:Transcript_13553/g.27726  ORF Transcript_13553/g.27726 Transcript_13553/m.27726 type:complete len:140 (-) Transcript_13553:531-950(-)